MVEFSLSDLLQLDEERQTVVYERGNRYGWIGERNDNGVFVIASNEKGKRLVTVTLENGTLIKADSDGLNPIAGAQVRLRKEGKQWVIQGNDSRVIDDDETNSSTAVGKHNHNIGNPLFTPMDLASVTDGLILPTGNGLEVVVGRVTYPKLDGTIGIYEDEDTQDLATAVTGLAANKQRWVVHYIARSDGSAGFHVATAVTGAVNATTDIEDAVSECLGTVSNAYPYSVTKIRAGMNNFGAYKAMQGRSPASKDMIRLGVMGAMGGSGAVLGAGVIKEIASDGLAVGSDRNIIVAAEDPATSDDLIEITGLSVGETIYLRADSGDTITVKHNDAGATIKIYLYNDADVVLDEQNPLVLTYVDTNVLSQWVDEAGSGTLSGLADTTITSVGDYHTLRYLSSAWINVKHNFTATTPPSVNDDNTQGYSLWSTWFDTITRITYYCHDATTGAADWGALLDNSTTQTVENKVINADNNTITNIGVSEVANDIITGQTQESSPTLNGTYVLGYDTVANALRKYNAIDILRSADGVVFVDPLAQTWTDLNQGSGSYIDNTDHRLTIVEDGDGTRRFRGWYTAYPSDPSVTPYTVTVHIKAVVEEANNNGYFIGWRQNSTMELAGLGCWYNSASGNIRLGSMKFDNENTHNSNYTTQDIRQIVNWVRLEDDGANRNIYISDDGIAWTLFHTVGNTDFLTPDQICFGYTGGDAITTFETSVALLSYEEG